MKKWPYCISKEDEKIAMGVSRKLVELMMKENVEERHGAIACWLILKFMSAEVEEFGDRIERVTKENNELRLEIESLKAKLRKR